jgi:serine/threonine-protein kinase
MAGGKEYEHDGKEIIYQLPNGFLGFYVVNGTGNRMDEAPGRAKGTGSATGLVTVGVGCMSCHAIGLFEKKDQIKPAVLKLAGFSADQLQLLSGLYADDSKIIGQIQADTQSYSSALTAANVDLKAPDPIGRILKKFHDSVDLKSAAGELGATADQVKSAIDGDASLSTTLSALTTGGSINRSLFQARFLDLMRKVYGP